MKEIKSRNAKKHIAKYEQDGFIHSGDALTAVGMAESDARNRTELAYCACCIYKDDAFECDSDRPCPGLTLFLKHYDEEI